jgi:hypothetical protein
VDAVLGGLYELVAPPDREAAPPAGRAAARALGGGARMADFDLSDYLKRSTEASGVPERLSDRDTILDVVRLILARRSVLPTDQRQTSDRQELPTFDRRAS